MQANLSLEYLVCPQNHARLRHADAPLIERLNKAIAGGQATTTAGRRLEKTIREGLIREDGEVVYAIVDEIPILLPDEGIAVDQLERF